MCICMYVNITEKQVNTLLGVTAHHALHHVAVIHERLYIISHHIEDGRKSDLVRTIFSNLHPWAKKYHYTKIHPNI